MQSLHLASLNLVTNFLVRDNHTKEQMATQIAMRLINSMEGH